MQVVCTTVLGAGMHGVIPNLNLEGRAAGTEHCGMQQAMYGANALDVMRSQIRTKVGLDASLRHEDELPCPSALVVHGVRAWSPWRQHALPHVVV